MTSDEETVRHTLTPEVARNYYFERLPRLPLETQLQFATFLYLWNGDTVAAQHLLRIKGAFTAHGDISLVFQRVIENTKTTHYDATPVGPMVAKYFKRHPNLYTSTWLLLYLMYLETVYGIDGRAQLLELVPLDAFRQTRRAIEQDSEALAMLSVVAANNIYGYNYLLRNDAEPVDPTVILGQVRSRYDLRNPMHLRFLTYLYTHFVIDESVFFAHDIESHRASLLTGLMQELEALVATHYFEISLDIKCEFLACCRSLGYEPGIGAVINNEVVNSKHYRGAFSYDRFNANPAPKRPTVGNMAHTMAYWTIGSSPRQRGERPIPTL
jgi:hypothetical protein